MEVWLERLKAIFSGRSLVKPPNMARSLRGNNDTRQQTGEVDEQHAAAAGGEEARAGPAESRLDSSSSNHVAQVRWLWKAARGLRTRARHKNQRIERVST